MAKLSIAEALREAIREEMRLDERVFCLGEDIDVDGGFGGAFTVTLGLSKEFHKWPKLIGYQLRYIYLIDKSCQINVPILPFSKIDEMGAGMYKGNKVTLAERQQAVEA